MAETGKNQNEIINAWQSLIEQSIKANTAFLEESSKIFTSLLSKKIEAKDLLKVNTEVLNAAASNFIKLNIAHTENLVNFGVNLSRSFFSFDKNNSGHESKTDASRGEQTESTATNTKSQINLAVKQGEQIATSFYLNSHNAFAQSGKFVSEDFINEHTGNTAPISMSISPKEFMLEPGKSLKIDISIGASKAVSAGKYKSIVRLEGMDNQEFDIVVEVLENKTAPGKISKPKAVVKNLVAKKAVKKTAAKSRKKK